MPNFHVEEYVCLSGFQTLLPFCQDEITEMKRKLKIMTHQVDQLKEEISAKESALVKLHLEQQRIEKEKETLKVPGCALASCGQGQLPLTESSEGQREPRRATYSLSC